MNRRTFIKSTIATLAGLIAWPKKAKAKKKEYCDPCWPDCPHYRQCHDVTENRKRYLTINSHTEEWKPMPRLWMHTHELKEFVKAGVLPKETKFGDVIAGAKLTEYQRL